MLAHDTRPRSTTMKWEPATKFHNSQNSTHTRMAQINVIVRARQFADPAPDRLGLCSLQRRDRGLAGGGMEGHAGEVEERLQQAALRVHVLHAPDRHERAPDRPGSRSEIDFVLADLVAPAPPAHGRDEHHRRQ